MAATSLAPIPSSNVVHAAFPVTPGRPRLTPWVDPHSVTSEELAVHITGLENACEQNPSCSELRTCLGIAYAMKFEIYKSMDALEMAISLDPQSFIAQFKYCELLYRLRALVRAEEEGVKAAKLATNTWELGMAQKMLLEIRRLKREGTQKPEWTKSLIFPALILIGFFLVVLVANHYRS